MPQLANSSPNII